ncbi:class I SAM-dependent methyltransferase [Thermopirellula anaerolimosa]
MSTCLSVSHSQRVRGSYRDPSGYVFFRGGRVFRAIDEPCFETLQRLEAAGLLSRWMDRRLLVNSRFVNEPALKGQLEAEHPGYHRFLEHERISPVSFPYEWSFSMLADAAILTLDLQLEAIEAGYSLKDGTPFNIQFRGPHPVFIDLPSIERPRRLDLWYALGQFNRTFLFPLLLHRHRGWDLRSYFLGNLDGRDSNAVVRSFGALGRWKPSLWLDVTLPWLLERMAERRPRRPAPVTAAPSVNREPVRLNLQRLRRKIVKLRDSHRPAGLWARYTAICNYDVQAEEGKKSFVRRMLGAASPASVLDLGCNTGDYALLAAESGCAVTAVDQDPESIDVLYRRAKDAAAPILPLVVDATNPSPALGFRLAERPSFYERARADCVFALALIHHLVVSGNLSLAATCDLFDDLTREHLLLEFVPPDDDMFQRLTRFRHDSFEHLTPAACRKVFGERFAIVEEYAVPHSKRILFWMRKR